MRKLTVFNHVSLDGFFTDGRGDMSWAHKSPTDTEWNAFVQGNASGGGALVFGRVTYEMMASFWPTPMALQMMPEVAAGMNRMPKIVFSRTLSEATWSNTTLIQGGDIVEQMRALKQQEGPTMAILGSGSIVSQFAQAGLIDEFIIVVNPLVLGKGRTLFETVDARLDLELVTSRAFQNGAVVLTYRPKPAA